MVQYKKRIYIMKPNIQKKIYRKYNHYLEMQIFLKNGNMNKKKLYEKKNISKRKKKKKMRYIQSKKYIE